MGRSWRYVAAWLAATAAAVTVSWFGVRVGVAPALTSEAPVAIDVDRRYTEVRLGPSEVVPEDGATPAPTAPARATPAPPVPARSPAARPSPSRSAAGRSAPTRSATASSATGSGDPGTGDSTEARPQVEAAPSPARAGAADRRPRYRIRAQGGVVTVAYSATRVDVVATDPIAGYVAGVDRRGERLLVVRLAGPRHASVVTVYWLGGPGARIMEEYAR